MFSFFYWTVAELNRQRHIAPYVLIDGRHGESLEKRLLVPRAAEGRSIGYRLMVNIAALAISKHL